MKFKWGERVKCLLYPFIPFSCMLVGPKSSKASRSYIAGKLGQKYLLNFFDSSLHKIKWKCLDSRNKIVLSGM